MKLLTVITVLAALVASVAAHRGGFWWSNPWGHSHYSDVCGKYSWKSYSMPACWSNSWSYPKPNPWCKSGSPPKGGSNWQHPKAPKNPGCYTSTTTSVCTTSSTSTSTSTIASDSSFCSTTTSVPVTTSTSPSDTTTSTSSTTTSTPATTTSTSSTTTASFPTTPQCTSEPDWEYSWQENGCAVEGTGYNTFEELTELDICDCIERCNNDWAQSCQFVNMYTEISRSTGDVIYKCAMYSDIHTSAKCINYGDVNVYIGNNSVAWYNPDWAPPAISGYTLTFGPIDTVVYNEADIQETYTLDQFIPQTCADKCSATSGCEFFNIYSLSVSGSDAYSTICQIYSLKHTASDATANQPETGYYASRSYGYTVN